MSKAAIRVFFSNFAVLSQTRAFKLDKKVLAILGYI